MSLQSEGQRKAKGKAGCERQSPSRRNGRSGKPSSGQRESGARNQRAKEEVWPQCRSVPERECVETSRTTHFIMLQAVDHQLGEDDHAGPPHSGAAVDDDRRVPVLGAFQHAVGMATDRLDLLQVGCKTKC